MDSNNYIIELNNSSLRLVAHLLHMELVAYPDNELASRTLTALREQTTFIEGIPERHGVFPSILEAPPYAEPFPQVIQFPVRT